MKDHRKYIKWYSGPFPLPSSRIFPTTSTKLTSSRPSLSLYVYNKIDSVSLDFLDKLAREPNTVVMSCELDLGIQDVVERCWLELQLMRIYTKRSVSLPPPFFLLFSSLHPSSRLCPLTPPPGNTEMRRDVQKGRGARLRRSADRARQVDDRRGVRPGASDAEGDVQVRVGVGREREACAAAGGVESCCC